MSEKIELFQMTIQQRRAWVLIMGSEKLPTSYAEMHSRALMMWNSIKENNPMRAFELFDESEVLGLSGAANDAVFGVDWEAEQT